MPTQMKILTMAIKKQLWNVVFLLNKSHLKTLYCAAILASNPYRSVEPIYKRISKFLDYDELCTDEGVRRKNFGR